MARAWSTNPRGRYAGTGIASVVAWGRSVEGQTDVPTDLSNVKAISAGQFHSLALKEDGTVVAWGYNGNGQTNVPTGLSSVTAIDAGGYHSLAIRDLVSPTVTSVIPAENATSIRPWRNVRAFFSEAMSPGSINSNTVKLFKVGENSALDATVTYNRVTNKTHLDPSANLKRGATYKAVVSTGVQGLAGNSLDQEPTLPENQPKEWFFKVRK